MKLTRNEDNTLTYKCLETPKEHIFRYYINQKAWEKIIIKAKLILRYKENPCQETVFDKVYEPE